MNRKEKIKHNLIKDNEVVEDKTYYCTGEDCEEELSYDDSYHTGDPGVVFCYECFHARINYCKGCDEMIPKEQGEYCGGCDPELKKKGRRVTDDPSNATE